MRISLLHSLFSSAMRRFGISWEMHALTAGRGGSYIEMSVEPSSKALEISVASPEPGRTGSQFYRSDSRDGTAALNLQE